MFGKGVLHRSDFVFALACTAFFGGCGDAQQEQMDASDEIGSREQLVRGGTAIHSPHGIWEAIGKVNNCTATIVSEFSALTASHCVTNGASATFNDQNGRGSIPGTAYHHPEFENLHWLSHDYAIIRFDASIYDTPTFDATDLQIMPVWDQPVDVLDTLIIVGFGAVGPDCDESANGVLHQGPAYIDEVEEDWHYRTTSTSVSSCPGDSGGPVLHFEDGKYQLVGVTSWRSGYLSYSRPSYMVTDWIHENSGRPDLPGDTYGYCVMYDTEVGGAWWSSRNSHSTLGSWNNRASAVWVRKGYKATLYNSTGYSSELDELDGFNGNNCNEYGCYHDLVGTSANNQTSSIRCESALPEDTWGHCIGYPRYGNGAYLSLRGNHSSFTGTSAAYDNKISHLWVRSGHTATIFPKTNYGGVVSNHWTSLSYSGNSGDWCNSYGCMHDLVGTIGENVASSLQCD